MSLESQSGSSDAHLSELRRTISHPSNNSIYRPKQSGLNFPVLPDFPTFAQERQHRKERLVAACRAFALHHLDYGFAGHLTVRDPEFPHLYWTNPMAVHFSQVKLSKLILLNLDGCKGVTDKGLAEVAKLSKLTILDLGFCDAITDAGLAEVAKLSKLTLLDLTYCRKVTDAGVARVRAALPNCKVAYRR